MTSPAVIDNSIVMRWFHPSGNSSNLAYTDKVLKSMEQGHISPIAPFILTMEFPNVLHTLVQRGELKGKIETALIHFEHLGFDIIGAEYSAALYIQAISELCSIYAISAYDAAYLELAIRQKCPLLTLDKKLLKAAKKAGVNTALKLI